MARIDRRTSRTFRSTRAAGLPDYETVRSIAFRGLFVRSATGRPATAGLNLVDCLTYAVAKVADRPLLFVGTDFDQTDLEPQSRGGANLEVPADFQGA